MDGAAYEPATAGEIFFRPPDADDLDAIYRLEVCEFCSMPSCQVAGCGEDEGA